MKIKKLTLILSLFALTACGNPISSSSFNSSSSNESTIPMVPSVVSETSSSNPTSSESSIVSSSSESSSSEPSSSSSSSSSEASSSESSSSSSESSSSSSSQSSSSSSESSSSDNSLSSSAKPVTGDHTTWYDGYYSSLESWTDGEDLISKLYTIMRTGGYHALSYDTPNWETNTNADHTKYDFELLDCVYTDKSIPKNQTNKSWQREHAFCASLMTGSSTGDAVKTKGRATDFHNLFASESSANGSRGNKNYGIVSNKTPGNYTDRTTNEGQDGYCYNTTVFEPGNYDKGRVSRAIFYMATMYKNEEYDSTNGVTMKGLTIVEDPVSYVSGNGCAFAHGNLSALLTWNNSYAVDYLEMQHNISVYRDIYTGDGYAQGNRNPYVDFPSLVDYAFGSKKNQPGTLDDLVPSSYYLDCGEHEFDHYALKQAKREYEPGTSISNNDYVVVKVFKDYTYSVTNTGYTNSLSDHVFSNDDGESIDATIMAGDDVFSYTIELDPLASCSSGALVPTTAGIDGKTPDVDQSVTFSGVGFTINLSGVASIASNGIYVTSESTGGIKLGSSTSGRQLTALTIKTVNSYTINAAYIKALAGNTNSDYQLVIKVGEAIFLESTRVNNQTTGKVYGKSLSSPMTGQISFIFTRNGSKSNSLAINSIAFNDINA